MTMVIDPVPYGGSRRKWPPPCPREGTIFGMVIPFPPGEREEGGRPPLPPEGRGSPPRPAAAPAPALPRRCVGFAAAQIEKCAQIIKDAQKCSKMFKSAPKHSRVFEK